MTKKPKERTFRILTSYCKASVLCYATQQGPGSKKREVAYDVTASTLEEAKRIAEKLRWADIEKSQAAGVLPTFLVHTYVFDRGNGEHTVLAYLRRPGRYADGYGQRKEYAVRAKTQEEAKEIAIGRRRAELTAAA